ncbi:hypothetical protein BLNAU_1092 [Blattamonas nauphoetae]|uniref:Uncharacterized protein n=1 Tax=Blattamonas nauphoetae TaxID=2049346 RepID=A0ABQ9YK31_9EUKA|nr:hypothetical protein BLNAU_1092 [Blattamonas nauphoetae]
MNHTLSTWPHYLPEWMSLVLAVVYLSDYPIQSAIGLPNSDTAEALSTVFIGIFNHTFKDENDLLAFFFEQHVASLTNTLGLSPRQLQPDLVTSTSLCSLFSAYLFFFLTTPIIHSFNQLPFPSYSSVTSLFSALATVSLYRKRLDPNQQSSSFPTRTIHLTASSPRLETLAETRSRQAADLLPPSPLKFNPSPSLSSLTSLRIQTPPSTKSRTKLSIYAHSSFSESPRQISPHAERSRSMKRMSPHSPANRSYLRHSHSDFVVPVGTAADTSPKTRTEANENPISNDNKHAQDSFGLPDATLFFSEEQIGLRKSIFIDLGVIDDEPETKTSDHIENNQKMTDFLSKSAISKEIVLPTIEDNTDSSLSSNSKEDERDDVKSSSDQCEGSDSDDFSGAMTGRYSESQIFSLLKLDGTPREEGDEIENGNEEREEEVEKGDDRREEEAKEGIIEAERMKEEESTTDETESDSPKGLQANEDEIGKEGREEEGEERGKKVEDGTGDETRIEEENEIETEVDEEEEGEVRVGEGDDGTRMEVKEKTLEEERRKKDEGMKEEDFTDGETETESTIRLQENEDETEKEGKEGEDDEVETEADEEEEGEERGQEGKDQTKDVTRIVEEDEMENEEKEADIETEGNEEELSEDETQSMDEQGSTRVEQRDYREPEEEWLLNEEQKEEEETEEASRNEDEESRTETDDTDQLEAIDERSWTEEVEEEEEGRIEENDKETEAEDGEEQDRTESGEEEGAMEANDTENEEGEGEEQEKEGAIEENNKENETGEEEGQFGTEAVEEKEKEGKEGTMDTNDAENEAEEGEEQDRTEGAEEEEQEEEGPIEENEEVTEAEEVDDQNKTPTSTHATSLPSSLLPSSSSQTQSQTPLIFFDGTDAEQPRPDFQQFRYDSRDEDTTPTPLDAIPEPTNSHSFENEEEEEYDNMEEEFEEEEDFEEERMFDPARTLMIDSDILKPIPAPITFTSLDPEAHYTLDEMTLTPHDSLYSADTVHTTMYDNEFEIDGFDILGEKPSPSPISHISGIGFGTIGGKAQSLSESITEESEEREGEEGGNEAERVETVFVEESGVDVVDFSDDPTSVLAITMLLDNHNTSDPLASHKPTHTTARLVISNPQQTEELQLSSNNAFGSLLNEMKKEKEEIVKQGRSWLLEGMNKMVSENDQDITFHRSLVQNTSLVNQLTSTFSIQSSTSQPISSLLPLKPSHPSPLRRSAVRQRPLRADPRTSSSLTLISHPHFSQLLHNQSVSQELMYILTDDTNTPVNLNAPPTLPKIEKVEKVHLERDFSTRTFGSHSPLSPQSHTTKLKNVESSALSRYISSRVLLPFHNFSTIDIAPQLNFLQRNHQSPRLTSPRSSVFFTPDFASFNPQYQSFSDISNFSPLFTQSPSSYSHRDLRHTSHRLPTPRRHSPHSPRVNVHELQEWDEQFHNFTFLLTPVFDTLTINTIVSTGVMGMISVIRARFSLFIDRLQAKFHRSLIFDITDVRSGLLQESIQPKINHSPVSPTAKSHINPMFKALLSPLLTPGHTGFRLNQSMPQQPNTEISGALTVAPITPMVKPAPSPPSRLLSPYVETIPNGVVLFPREITRRFVITTQDAITELCLRLLRCTSAARVIQRAWRFYTRKAQLDRELESAEMELAAKVTYRRVVGRISQTKQKEQTLAFFGKNEKRARAFVRFQAFVRKWLVQKSLSQKRAAVDLIQKAIRMKQARDALKKLRMEVVQKKRKQQRRVWKFRMMVWTQSNIHVERMTFATTAVSQIGGHLRIFSSLFTLISNKKKWREERAQEKEKEQKKKEKELHPGRRGLLRHGTDNTPTQHWQRSLRQPHPKPALAEEVAVAETAHKVIPQFLKKVHHDLGEMKKDEGNFLVGTLCPHLVEIFQEELKELNEDLFSIRTLTSVPLFSSEKSILSLIQSPLASHSVPTVFDPKPEEILVDVDLFELLGVEQNNQDQT